jgi:ABC-2 type transport system ATP-binding protein
MIPALQLEQLSQHFGGKKAVDNLSLEVMPGELLAFLGLNGAGKTTTLRMVAGLLKPTSGDASILGSSITRDPKAAKAKLAYLPDDPLLYAKLTPLEMLELIAGLWQVNPKIARFHAQEWLEKLELWQHRGERIEVFSRGMKQKLAFAGAMIHDPHLLILDEPLTGLDVAAARTIKDVMLEFTAMGRTLILTTHILDVAEELATRIAVIDHGKLLALGSLEELRRSSGEAGNLESVFLRLTRVHPPVPAPPLTPSALEASA